MINAGLLLLLVPVLFILPIITLSVIGDDIKKKTGVLVAFTMTFGIVLIIGTHAKPHEILSCSAAYLAVLVVFYGSVNSRNPGN